MQKNPNQPRVDDAVLGNQIPVPTDSVVVGGIEGIKSRLASQVVVGRIAALKEALNHWEAGLDLIISALHDESDQVKLAAYSLLQQQKGIKVRQALQGFNHWQLLKCLCTFEGNSSRFIFISISNFIPISSDGRRVFVGGYGGRIRICDWRTRTIQTQSLQGHSEELEFSVISSDEQKIIGGSHRDARIKTWDLQTGEILYSPIKEYSSGINSITLCKDNQTIIVGNYFGDIKVYNLQTAKLMFDLKAHSGSVQIALSPDEKTLVSGGGQTVKVWNWRKRELLHTIEEPHGATCLAVKCNNKILVSSNTNNKIKVRDLRTAERLTVLNETPNKINNLAISPDGQTIISGVGTGKINVWNWQKRDLKHTIEAHSSRIDSLYFAPNGQTIVSTSQGEVKVWGLEFTQA